MSWKPHITVAAVVERDARFLMIEEVIDGKAVFNQPAGHLEAGESLPKAAQRETFEETGWHVEPSGFLGVSVCENPRGNTYVRITFVARALEHDPKAQLDDGIIRALWMSAEEIRAKRDLLRSPMVLKAIEDYQSRGPQAMELCDYISLQ